jgi:hypothetical protein
VPRRSNFSENRPGAIQKCNNFTTFFGYEAAIAPAGKFCPILAVILGKNHQFADGFMENRPIGAI